jgi:hypothetical protein
MPELRRMLAFLSHKYRSFEVNLALHAALRESADIRFEVDEGLPETSITRLARMVRRADCFIGMFTLPGDPRQNYEAAELRRESRYYRLELDLAVRARKPALVLVDDRFRGWIPVPRPVREVRFNAQDLLGGVLDTSERIAAAARELVVPSRPYTLPGEDSRVIGVIRSDPVFDAAEAVARDEGLAVRSLPLPPAPDLGGIAEVSGCDWVIADVTVPANAHYLGVLHGLGVPVLRLARSADGGGPFYGSLQAQYDKELVRWDTVEELTESLRRRIRLIEQPALSITGRDQAEWYFRRAGLHTEPVFLSFAREDTKFAGQLHQALSLRFEKVYSYERTPNMIGSEWREELHRQLAAARIGVAVISKEYQQSPWCQEEAAVLMSRRPDGVLVYPIQLDGTRMEVFGALEYRRFWTDPDTAPSLRGRSAEELADEIAAAVKAAKSGTASGPPDGILLAED